MPDFFEQLANQNSKNIAPPACPISNSPNPDQHRPNENKSFDLLPNVQDESFGNLNKNEKDQLGIFGRTGDEKLDLDTDDIDKNSIEFKIARLITKSYSIEAILKMYSLDIETLKQIQNSEDYKLALTQAEDKENLSPIKIDDDWDEVEKASLEVVKKHVVENKHFLSPDDAIRFAAIANRATRKRTVTAAEKLDAEKSGNTTNVLHLELSSEYVQRMGSLNPALIAQKIKEEAGKKKIVDYMPPTEIDKLVAKQSATLNLNVLDAIEEETEPEIMDAAFDENQ